MAKKVLVRICIIVFIIGLMWFSDRTFAAEGDGLKILWLSLNYIVSVLAWIWIFFAKLAGTFLTNSWVYGEILWLDALLWKFWNVMKNIANFWLWFYFVYVIFWWLIKQWKEEITKKLKDIILWLLIAWVWIQTSWFFVATVIDISTITLAAAWSFPSQVLSVSPYVESAMKKSLSDYLSANEEEVVQGKEISLFPRDQNASSLLNTKTVKLVYAESFTGLVDSLMPNADDVSWPLYFIWFTILKTNVLTSIDTSSDNWVKGVILNTIIQGWTTIVFAIEMLILCVLALIRIIYLWMFIVLSPLAVLIRCIEKSRGKSWNWGWFLAKFTKQISFKTFFINVFKPTVIVLCFWIAIIFVALMNKVVLDYKDRPIDMKWMTMYSEADPQSNANGNPWDKTYKTVMDNDFLRFTLAHSWKTLLELVLSIMTVLIIYHIIKIAVSMWNSEDFVSKSVGNMQRWLETIIGSAPVVPVPAYDEYGRAKKGALSFSALKRSPWLLIGESKRGLDQVQSSQTDKVLKMWWFDRNDALTQEETMKIVDAWWLGTGLRWLQILDAKRKYINSIKTDEWKWMSLSSTARDGGFWRSEFKKWLNDVKSSDLIGTEWQNLVNEWQKETDVKKRDLEKLFNNPKYAKLYANYFDYKWDYNNFSSIKDLDISKK